MMIKAAIKEGFFKPSIVFSLLLMGIVVSSLGCAVAEKQPNFSWSNYPEPFTDEMFAWQNGANAINSAKLEVNLPQNLTETTLVLQIGSDVEGAFKYLRPYLRVEGASEKKKKEYPIPVKNDLIFQQVTVPMKNLAAGKTILTFSFEWINSDWECVLGDPCGYTIYALYFTDNPSVVPEPTVAPEPKRKPGVSRKQPEGGGSRSRSGSGGRR
jgi:hypothetical protein